MQNLRQVLLTGFVLLLALAVGAQERRLKYALDLKIAKFAIIAGNNRLAKDISDRRGLDLIRFGSVLDPENELGLLAMGYVKRGTPPEARELPVPETEIVEVMANRACELSENELPRNTKLGPLCRLYATFAEQTQPENPDVVLALTRLAAKGHKETLADLLQKPMDVKDIFGSPTPPPPTERNVKLSKKDLEIAQAAAEVGTNRLAQDPGDVLGLKLLQLSALLAPDGNQVLLTMGLMFRQKTPLAVKTAYLEKQVKEMLVARGLELAEKEDQPRRRLGLLYLRMAEEFGVEDRIILAEAKLEKAGVKGELHELLTTAVTTVAVTATGNPAETTDQAATGLTKTQIKNLGLDASVKKSSRKRSARYDPTEIVVIAALENKNPEPIQDLTVSVFIIASETKARKEFMVVKREDFDELAMAGNAAIKPVEIQTACYEYTNDLKRNAPVGFQPEFPESFYYGYVVVLRDRDGKIIKTEVPSDASLIRDLVPKIAEMKDNWHFDREGTVTARNPEIPRITGTDTADSIRDAARSWRPPGWGRRR